MKQNIHPAYHKLLIQFPQGDVCQTYSTSSAGTLLIDVDYRKHPAWTKSGIAGANESSARVAKFNQKVGGFTFSSKKKS